MCAVPIFGQLVIGPAGSGKTTYCKVMSQHLTQIGRKVMIVNIDPANDVLPYDAAIDINNLITVQDVMNKHNLGPNGALLFCMDFLETNFEWILEHIYKLINTTDSSSSSSSSSLTTTTTTTTTTTSASTNDASPSSVYLLFDCPGQSELYTHHPSLKNVLNKLISMNSQNREKGIGSSNMKSLDLRLVAVNIVDSHYANDASKFISVLMNSLSTMLHLELPHVNVLSKIDLFEKYGKVHFGLDFYCDVLDLNYLVDQIDDDPFFEKYKKLTKALAGIIEDYGLVSFLPLDINNTPSVLRVLQSIDKSNGYYLKDLDEDNLEMFYKKCEAADFDAAKYGEFLEKFS